MFDGWRTDHSSRIVRVRVVSLAVVMLMACATVFAANNPVPFIDLPTVPSAAVPGGTGFTLTVNGAGFVTGSVVNWNRGPRTTTFVSAGQVTAAILASDIATASTAAITVMNPVPGGGTSNAAYFEVTTPASTVIVSGLQLPAFTNLGIPFAVDLNHDGKLDLVFYAQNASGVWQGSAVLGNGDGTFQPAIAIVGADIQGGSPTGKFVLADFNGDGKLDMALVNELPSPAPSTIVILLGNGDGTFQAPMTTGVQANTEYNYIAAGDFNQDGKLDIVTTYFVSSSNSGISILFGNGDGTFQAPVNSQNSFFDQQLTVGDFNGDGVLDLAGGSAIVALGNGDGTFQSPITSSGTSGLQNVSAADVNGDGKLDLVVSSSADPRPLEFFAGVEIGDGSGGLTIGAGVGGSPAFPAGDFNGDGKLDFVTSTEDYPFPPDELQIWMGNGDGTFATAVPITTTTGLPLTPAIQGDFNGDGKVDLIAYDGNGLAWLFLQGSFPVASFSVGSLNFGNQTLGTTSAPQTVTVSNTGMQTLTLSAVSITGTNQSQFKQTNNCTNSLAVGAACQITVKFVSTVAGTQSATLNIPHNGAGNQTVALTGVGDSTPPTVKLPAALVFPAQSIGTKISGPVVLSNPGPGTVTEPVITLTGSDAGDFSETNNCSSDLLAGATCQVTVTFAPTTVGSRDASLNFADNAAGSPQSVSLKGSGPDFATTAPTPASLSIAAGQTANYTFDIEPLAGFSQAVTLTCGGAPAGAKCTLPASVTLNGSSNMTVAVSVSTTARAGAVKRSPFSNAGRWLACGVFGLPLLVSMAGVGVRRHRTRVVRLTFLLLMTSAMLLLPACGGGNGGGGGSGSGTPAGTYQLTVAGKYTAGGTTLTHTATLTLVVE
jgi:hypothetical protein